MGPLGTPILVLLAAPASALALGPPARDITVEVQIGILEQIGAVR